MVVFSVKETRQIWMRRVGCEFKLTITPQLHTPVTPALAIEAHLMQKLKMRWKRLVHVPFGKKFWRPTVWLQTFDIIDNVWLWKWKLWEQRAWWTHLRMTCRHRPSPGQAYGLYSWLYKLMAHEKYFTYNLHINPRGPCFTILTQKVPLKLRFKDRVINFIQHHIGCQHRSWITPQKYVVLQERPPKYVFILPGVWLSSLLHSTGMFRSFWNG